MPTENEIRNFIQAIPKMVKSLTYDDCLLYTSDAADE